MPLEATVIIIDNSEYMRNGDYLPTRFDAQSDAVNTVFQTKTDSNPENSVGLMTMASKSPEVLVTNTKDLGQILQALHSTSSKIGGTVDIPTSIAVAQLALKHRQNKNLRQRIIVFVASPLEGEGTDERSMVKLAKKLKKNNVAVDVVAYGDAIEEGEQNVLKAFVDNASTGDNSHYVAVPPGPHLLSDMVINSPILAGDRGIPEELVGNAQPSGSGAPSTNFEFGVDPSLDPELAMALRMSMEEENARQAAAANTAPPPAPATNAASASITPAYPPDEEEDGDEEEALLKKALAMSQGEDVNMEGHSEEDDGEDDEEMSEEEAIARAIQMSMKDGSGDADNAKK